MSRVPKHAFYASIAMIIGGCSGGGCGGCACITPLPGGFEPTKRIENAGSARLTDSGIAFLEQNLGALAGSLVGGGMAQGGVLTFDIPAQGAQDLFVATATPCPNGPLPNNNPPQCVAEVDLGNAQFDIQPTAPHNLVITGPIPIRAQDILIHVEWLGGLFDADTSAVLNGNNACPGSAQTFAMIDVTADVSIEADLDPNHARFGYSRVRVNTLTFDQAQLEAQLHFCGGGLQSDILNALKGFIIPQLIGPLTDTLNTTIEDQLCQKSNPMLNPPCPTGTNDVNGTCRYGTQDSDECVPIILGLDGNMDIGSALASISPGTKGGLDILFAAGGSSPRGNGLVWGDANPANQGVTLGLFGGAEPKPVSKCVQESVMPIPTGVPIPQTLFGNTVPDWPAALPGPHMGFALNERFFNYALNGVYNSGALCLGIAIDNPLLSTGTFGLLAPSMTDVGIQRSSQPIAIVVRPGAPPTAVFGKGSDIATDPLIRIGLPNASFDFYVWSLDRYIRFMTATYDLDVPLNITVTPEGLTPVLQNINMNNGQIVNAPLLGDDPAILAEAISSLVSGQVGQLLGGGLSPIDINSSLAGLGLKLVIPETVDGVGSPGLTKISEGTDNYLAIFAALDLATPSMSVADTSAVVLEKTVDRNGLYLANMTKDNAPKIRLGLSSTLDSKDGDPVLFSYRIDNGFWSVPTDKRELVITDPILRAQGRHVIKVRARSALDPWSLDPTPAEVEVVIDRDAPTAKIEEKEIGKVNIQVDDRELGRRASVRYRLDRVSGNGIAEGTWSDWMDVNEQVDVDTGDANIITVETKDEEGNFAQTSQALRGKIPVGMGGCACQVVGGDDRAGGLAALLAAIAVGVRLRKRSKTAKKAPPPPAAKPRARKAKTETAAIAALGVIALGASFSGCNCGDQATGEPPTGDYKCDPPGCNPLEFGLIGAYSSVAINGSEIWVAGYAEAHWDSNHSWGDLVVGRWDGAAVQWEAVDGVPTDPPPDTTIFDKNGFRGGQDQPGDDVGIWTSIALDAAGHPGVAYYDRSHRALKFAQSDGTNWTVTTVQQKVNADIGRYAKLVFANGQFVIAFQVTEPGSGGAVRSVVRIAKGNGATWAFTDAVADEATPCKKYFCAQGTACFRDTGKCEAPAAGCMPSCASGTECATRNGADSCIDVFDANYLETYPDAIGLYISLAVGPGQTLGLSYYDRIRGNLVIAKETGTNWTTTIVDGADAMGNDNGDKGIGSSLWIDDGGDFHLSYVDGIDEALKYVVVTGGDTVGTPELVDDGFGIEQAAFMDGQHLVGDDSHVFVTQGGEIKITYQDATNGKLRLATGTPNATGHSWLVQEITQEGWAGAFSNVFEVDGGLMIASWWRQGGLDAGGAPKPIVGDVRIMSP